MPISLPQIALAVGIPWIRTSGYRRQVNSTPVEPFLDKAGIPYDKNFYDQYRLEEKPLAEEEGRRIINGIDVTGTWSDFLPQRWVDMRLRR